MLLALMLPFASQAQNTQTFDFEDNAIPADWTNDATYPWVVTSVKNHTTGGSYSIKSGNAGQNSTNSDIEATFFFYSEGTISFYCWSSCESASNNWDYGMFFIDGVQQGSNFLDVTDWVYKTFTVPAGTHTFKWRFRKDISSAGGDDCFYVDDIVIDLGEIPSCFPVLALQASEINAESVTLSWVDENNTGATYSVYQISGTDTTEVDNVVIANNTAVITELTSNTNYTFGVVADCGDAGLSSMMSVDVRTACGVITIDDENSYSEDFNSYTTDIATSTTAPSSYPNHTMPSCWSFLNMSSSSSYYPMAFLSTYSGYPVSGNCLFFKSSSSTPLYAIMPAFSTEGTIRLQFSYRNESTGSSNGTLSVGYITDATDASTFTAVETFPQITTITSAEALFASSMLANGARIAFRYTGGDYDNYYLSIDNVVVEQGPSCMKVINLTADAVTSESVTLSWTSDAENFIVYNMADSSVVANVTEPAAMITGLNSNTAYTFGVVVDCGDGDISDTVCINVRTACSTISQLPWTDNCEEVPSGDYQMPYCWSRYADANHYPYSYANNAHSGLRALYWYLGPNTTYSTYADTAIAILPQVDIETLTISELQLSFYGRMGDASANILVYVGTMSDPEDASTFQMEDTVRVSGNTYNRFDINLTNAPTTNSYVAIMALRPTTSVSLYIDDVILHEQPTCAHVTNTAAIDSLATEESVTISWEDLNNTDATYTIYNMADSSVVGTGIDNTVYTIVGLSASTIYTFGIAANCGDSDAEIITVFARTACGVVTIDDENSYSEDFNSYTTDIATSSSAPSNYPNHTMPSCWSFLNMSSSSSYYPMAFLSTNSGYPVSGNCLFFKSSSSTPIYAILPIFANEGSTRIRFSYRNEGVSSSNGILSVGYITDSTDASTFTAVATFPQTTTITSAEALFTSSMLADSARIAFRYTGGSSDNYYLSIDNVVVEQGPSCLPVINLTADSVTSESVTLNWSGDADNYAVIDVVNEESFETEDNTYTITDLEPNTLYTFGVVSLCSDGNSDTVFTTVRTQCAAIDLPLVESFEDSSETATCWTFDGNSVYNNGNMGITTASGHKVMKFLVDSYDGSVSSNYLQYGYSPVLNVSDEATALNVKVRYSTYYSSWGTYVQLYFGYKLADGTEIWGENGHRTSGTSTYAYYTDTIPATAVQVMVKYHATSYSSSYIAYIDSVMIEEIEDELCFPVANLAVDSASASTISLSWVSDADNFTILNMADSSVVATCNETNYTVEELDANTSYTYGVVVNCASGNSDTMIIECRTACTPIVIDSENRYTENFNSYTTDISTSTTAPSNYPNHTMPYCWSFLNMSSSSSSYPMAFLSTNSGYPVSGNCLFFRSSSTTPIYAIMPEFVINGTAELVFKYRNESVSSYNGTLYVGVMTNIMNENSFIVLDTCAQISTITEKGLYIADTLLTDGARIAFRYSGGSSDNYYLSIDDIMLRLAPTCMPVSDLAVDSVTTESITLSWTSESENFTIINMANDSIVGTTSDLTYVVENLSASTNYTFGVIVNCDDDHSDTVTISANTACADVTVFPFTESFEGTDLGCWTSEGQSTWTVGAGNYSVTTAYFGNKNAKIGHNVTGDVTKLISPVLTTEEEVSALKVTFAHVQSRWSSDVDVHRVLYRTSEEGDWNEAVSYIEEITSWTVDSVMLPGNTYQIAFEFIDGYGYGVGIDSVVISTFDGNFCWPATSLTVDDEATTANSVTITWEGTAANYSIYNGQTVVATTTDNTYTLTNLAANSTYVIGVRALCSAEDSSDLVTVLAHTLCGAITEFPYEQTFDAEPSCWTKIDADGDGYNWYVPNGYSSIQSASWVSPATPLTPDNWLITPQISLPATGSYEVTWTAMAQDQDWPMEHYGIFISTTGNTDTSDFTMIQEWTLGSGAFNPVIDLSAYAGQDIYLALRHFNCTDVFRISIDDFIIREQPGANQVVINLQQNNPAYGSVTGAGVYNIGDNVTVSATPASSYVFNRWVDENNVTVSSDNPYTFVAATDLTLKAIFLSSSADTYTITVEVNDSTMGTATGGGVYADGDAAVLIATAYPGYRFVNWTHTSSEFGVIEFSTDDTTIVTVTGDKTYTANFEAGAPVVDTFTVTLNTTDGGTVSPMGSTRVADGTLFTATATADSGYHFVNWTNANGAAVSTNNPYAFTVNADVTLTAHFQANDPQVTYYNVIITSADSTMGTATATATGQVAENTSVTATAVALTGYRFVNWTDANGTVVNATNPYTFTVTSDVTLKANFVANGPTPVEATIAASEITYWVGEGSNQAVVAINWADAAYAWGVKFSAASITVQDALDIIKGTDRRFDYTLGDYGLENITFDENDIHLSGSSAWNQKLNNEYGTGLAQNVVNGDFVKWGEENAGTVVDSTYYEDWGWYYTYVFEMTILPIWAYVGIQSVDMSNVSIYSANSTIYVKGAEGQIINIYDLNGRTIVTKLNATETMEIPMEETGVYLVRIGNAPAKRVIVMR